MYTPNNVCVYLKAAAGCLSGLGGSGPYGDPLLGDFSGYARMADAYAQEFDTVWGVTVPSGFEEDAIFTASAAAWATRSPLPSTVAFIPGAYNGIVLGVIARVLEGNAQIVSEGVDPNGCGGGIIPPPPFPDGNWIDIAPGTTVSPVALGAMYKTDSTGALVQYVLPSGPVNGFTFLIKLVGGSVVNPVSLLPGAGDTCEDPQNAGTFSAVPVFISTAGAIAAFKYDAPAHQWVEFI
jgi:hypothetical protein